MFKGFLYFKVAYIAQLSYNDIEINYCMRMKSFYDRVLLAEVINY